MTVDRMILIVNLLCGSFVERSFLDDRWHLMGRLLLSHNLELNLVGWLLLWLTVEIFLVNY